MPDGTAMVYVSFQRGQAERQIRKLDPATGEDRLLATMPPCSHLMSNHDGSLIVGDGSGDDPHLHLFDLRAGTRRRVARHDTSWAVHQGNRQATHPHPSFSPDSRHVMFTSDRDGAPPGAGAGSMTLNRCAAALLLGLALCRPAGEVPARVRAGAGTGRLWTGTGPP